MTTINDTQFSNLCNAELYDEAKKLISSIDAVDAWKAQVLEDVEWTLECGRMVRTSTGGETVAFSIGDVKRIVDSTVLKHE